LGIDDVSFRGVDNPGALFNQTLASRRTGQEIKVQVFRPSKLRMPRAECNVYTPEGAYCTYTFRLVQMPVVDFLIQYGIGLIVAVILLVIGVLVWTFRRHQTAARLTGVMCAALAYIAIGRFNLASSFQGTLMIAAVCVLAAVCRLA
jgi:hypothetical protein